MSLRKLWSIVSAGVFFSLVLGTIGLGIVAGELRQATMKTVHAMRASRTVQALQVDLFAYHRLRNLFFVSADESYKSAADEKRSELERDAAAVMMSFTDPDYRQVVAATVDGLTDYLDASSRMDANEQPFEEIFRSENLALETILISLDELDRSLAEEAEEARLSAANWERRGYLLAAMLFALALLGSTLVFVLVRQGVYLPLLRLREGIRCIQPGQKVTALPVAGVREVQVVAASINQLAEELHAQRHQQLEFLSAVAHDLRTPLTSIKGFTQLLARSHPLPDEEKLYSTFELLDRQSNRIHRMVDDLLEATRVEGGHFKVSFAPCDIVAVVEEVASMMRTGESREIEVRSTHDKIESCCDGSRLQQVLSNLVSNALKYSSADQPVVIDIRKENGHVAIAVTDRGIGIAPEDIQGIFEPFRRTVLTRHEYPGVGLGLSVSKRLVEAHQGRIDVESEPGQGSTFRIWLPLRQDCDSPPL